MSEKRNNRKRYHTIPSRLPVLEVLGIVGLFDIVRTSCPVFFWIYDAIECVRCDSQHRDDRSMEILGDIQMERWCSLIEF